MLKYLNSSIGKKYIMGITGQCLCAFLVMHLAGNLTLFSSDHTIFDNYAQKLEDMGALLYLAEVGLVAMFLVHILTAIRLTMGNKQARPVKYVVDNSSGEKRWASSTMVFSGIIIIIFLVVHIIQFKFGTRVAYGDSKASLYGLVLDRFQQLHWAAFYVVALSCLSLHLSHGFQSAFQSLGINHPRYTPTIKTLGLLYAVSVGGGFIVIPIYMHLCVKGGV